MDSTPRLSVRDLRLRGVHVPLRLPLVTRGGTIEIAPLALVDLLTDEGVTGSAYLFCCTPLALKPVLQTIVGDGVTLIDTAEETTRQVARELEQRGLARASRGAPQHAFFVSDIPAQFEEVGSRFLGRPIGLPVWVDQNDLPWYDRDSADADPA